MATNGILLVETSPRAANASDTLGIPTGWPHPCGQVLAEIETVGLVAATFFRQQHDFLLRQHCVPQSACMDARAFRNGAFDTRSMSISRKLLKTRCKPLMPAPKVIRSWLRSAHASDSPEPSPSQSVAVSSPMRSCPAKPRQLVARPKQRGATRKLPRSF